MNHVLRTALTLVCVSTPAAAEDGFSGQIKAEDGRRYQMQGERRLEGEQRHEKTRYSRDGELLLKQRVVYRERDLRLTSLELENLKTGRRETINRKGEALEITFRETTGAETKQKLMRPDGQVLHGTQIGALLKRSIPALERGEEVEFQLLSPQHMMAVGFRLRKVGTRKLGVQDCLKVRMEPIAWYVRAFVDRVHFYATTAEPFRIVRVEGMVLSTDENGKPVQGVMTTQAR